MSYILDALKKSQQARRRGSVTISRGSVHRISPSLSDNGLWFTAGIIMLMGVTTIVFLFWRNTPDRTPVSLPETVTSEAVAQPAGVSLKNDIPRFVPPDKPATSTSQVRDLAEEARVTAPTVAVARQKAMVIKPDGKAAAVNSNQQMNSLSPISLVSDDTPLLQQMPTEFQRALPRLAVTIHVYSPQESQRILFINNREYHKGDHIESDISVEEIVPDGVVLSFRGERFKLGRPR